MSSKWLLLFGPKQKWAHWRRPNQIGRNLELPLAPRPCALSHHIVARRVLAYDEGRLRHCVMPVHCLVLHWLVLWRQSAFRDTD